MKTVWKSKKNNKRRRQSIKRKSGNINNIENNQEKIEQMEISFNIPNNL